MSPWTIPREEEKVDICKEYEGTPKAKKEYWCQYCGGTIVVDEVYYKRSFLHEGRGKWFLYRLHTQCKDAFFVALRDMYAVGNHWETWHEETFI